MFLFHPLVTPEIVKPVTASKLAVSQVIITLTPPGTVHPVNLWVVLVLMVNGNDPLAVDQVPLSVIPVQFTVLVVEPDVVTILIPVVAVRVLAPDGVTVAVVAPAVATSAAKTTATPTTNFTQERMIPPGLGHIWLHRNPGATRSYTWAAWLSQSQAA
ncbi:hypothetical protein [Conexibacter woesei]|uniref:hypothetical protein n=1 Tax=Conexibacter woesei TaxID=191495 RepID=UPI000550672F|nr:hypothetical protein [Conexibacter woesei]